MENNIKADVKKLRCDVVYRIHLAQKGHEVSTCGDGNDTSISI
jgi:hypothetical protein